MGTPEIEMRHRNVQKHIGESLRGRDRRIFTLLYALAYYAATDAEMVEAELSFKDIQSIQKVFVTSN